MNKKRLTIWHDISIIGCMIWIEIIHLRTSHTHDTDLLLDVSEEVTKLKQVAQVKHAGVLTDVEQPTDIGILIIWEQCETPSKSRSALALAAYLEQFGTVEHSLWSEFSEVRHARK